MDGQRKEMKESKAGTVVGFIFSIVFSIIFMAVLVILNSVLMVKLTCNDIVSGSGIRQNLDLKSIPIGEFVSSMELEGVEIDETTELSDIIYGVFNSAGILVSSKEQVEDMLDNMNVESLLDSVKSEYLKVFLGEQRTASISKEQLLRFIEDNRAVIGTALSTEFTDLDIAKIGYFLEWNNIEEQTTLELPEDYLEVIEIVRLFLGDTNRLNVIAGVGIAVVMLLLLVCNWKRKYGVFFYTGLGFALPGAGGLWISGMLGVMASKVLEMKSTIVDMLLSMVSETIVSKSYLFLCIGGGLLAVFLISFIVVKVWNRRNRE